MKLLKLKRLVKYVLRNRLNVIDDLILAEMIVERLHSLPKEGWLYYWQQFNHWKFPEDFYDLIPGWLDPKKNNTDRLMIIHGKAMRIIANEFTLYQILRFCNTNEGRMTHDEFEYWWLNQNEDSLWSIYYPRERQFKAMHFWEDDIWNKLKSAGLVDKPVNIKDN